MQLPRKRRRIGRFEYDAAAGNVVIAGLVGAVIVLSFLALTYQGSPRMDDLAKVQQGATIPNPTQLSPAETTGAPSLRR
jgi:hypothetical protein